MCPGKKAGELCYKGVKLSSRDFGTPPLKGKSESGKAELPLRVNKLPPVAYAHVKRVNCRCICKADANVQPLFGGIDPLIVLNLSFTQIWLREELN